MRKSIIAKVVTGALVGVCGAYTVHPDDAVRHLSHIVRVQHAPHRGSAERLAVKLNVVIGEPSRVRKGGEPVHLREEPLV